MRNMYEANKYGWRQISNYRCEYPMCGSRILFQLGWGSEGSLCLHRVGVRGLFSVNYYVNSVRKNMWCH